MQFKPLAVLRSLLAVVVGYAVFAIALTGAVMAGWGGIVEAPSAVLAPVAVVIMVLGLAAGGAIAALLAGKGKGGHGLLVGVIALVVLVAGLFAGDPVEPNWFRIVGAAVSLPISFLGAELSSGKPIKPL